VIAGGLAFAQSPQAGRDRCESRRGRACEGSRQRAVRAGEVLRKRARVPALQPHPAHYWTNLGGKGGEPTGDLAKAINADFGSYAKFKSQLAAVSGAVEASGWGLLGYHPSTRKLMILQVENHQKQTAWGVVPLLTVDVFEHATSSTGTTWPSATPRPAHSGSRCSRRTSSLTAG
jgi:hypothetical protein